MLTVWPLGDGELAGNDEELPAAGRWDDSRITVSFHPALPEGYSTEHTPAVRIGRVYVTHG